MFVNISSLYNISTVKMFSLIFLHSLKNYIHINFVLLILLCKYCESLSNKTKFK